MLRFNTLCRWILLILGFSISVPMFRQCNDIWWRLWDNKSDIILPRDLQEQVMRRFDELAGKEELLYVPSIPEHFEDDGFKFWTILAMNKAKSCFGLIHMLYFEVRMTPILKQKPILPPGDPGRVKSGGPFINPNPSEIITKVGTRHQLLLNKYCVYRPMLVLPTIEFEKQTTDLDKSDIAAVWAVLNTFAEDQIAIYNCGINSGSSQGHKHMQIYPKPDPTVYTLWPSLAHSSQGMYLSSILLWLSERYHQIVDHVSEVASRIPNVPFQHFVLQIVKDSSASQVHRTYQRLLSLASGALLEAGQDHDYNVVITKEWMAVIPRSRTEWGGPFGANASGMLGLISVRDQEEKDRWSSLGWAVHLRELGVPHIVH